MSEEPTLFDLEERLVFLERHVQQQDLEIYTQSEQIRRLQTALAQLRAQSLAQKDGTGEAEATLPLADERPPHY